MVNIKIITCCLLAISINVNAKPRDDITWLELNDEPLPSAVEKLDKYYPGRIRIDNCIKHLRVTANLIVTTPLATVAAVEFLADLLRLRMTYSNRQGDIKLLSRQPKVDCPPSTSA